MKKIVQDPYENQVNAEKEYLTLKDGDTLVAKFDLDNDYIGDIENCNKIMEYFSEAFPENKIVGLFNGIELSVIKKEERV